ncbi:uncharacterized protein EURHEDRAFT_389092 [Aspergillus ruber CBS 135680]|uniref:Uncharacterized protein n=1 Tax=Aspergillus ruber (strain CBS 135680) TaxID=1388766 RepID=A0A017S4I9_ASPRC|nr:uncharacterized protein EURHEDRAFT_389092 [Aspergillus ruber CBS 135680]EYE91877.1 hypothetical protein EURHEDRAFT_389092 [Aspergillus ruber CBS 135680]
MRFTSIVSLLALAASANAAISASELISSIDAITKLSFDTNDIAKDISATNILTKSPQLLNNLKQIIQSATKDINAINSERSLEAHQESPQDAGEAIKDPSENFGEIQDPFPYSDAEQLRICDSFEIFTAAKTLYLNTLVKYAGLLNRLPSKLVAAIFTNIENYVVDPLAFFLIDKAPACGHDVMKDENELDRTFSNNIDKFSI